MLTYPVSTTPPNNDATFLPSCLEEFEAGSLTADCRGSSMMVGSIISDSVAIPFWPNLPARPLIKSPCGRRACEEGYVSRQEDSKGPA